MPPQNRETYREIESLIRRADFEAARACVKSLVATRLPRAELATVAQFANRAGLPDLGLRLLGRVVRPPPRAPATASDREKAEFAASLIQFGAVESALMMLDGVNPGSTPKALLYRAIAHARRWDYPGTLPLLKRYLAVPGLSLYERMVGEVNLAAALVFLRKSVQASALLRRLLHESQLRGFALLRLNALELSSEHFLLARDWRAARALLAGAPLSDSRESSSYDFLLFKWRRILDYLRGKSTSLDELRAAARRRHHWEVLRDCDRFTVSKTHDIALGRHLYFGTPFAPYRERLRDEVGDDVLDPPEYLWSSHHRRVSFIVDLSSGEVARGKHVVASLKQGFAIHRLLVALCADFYRPVRIAELHAAIYPGEFFSWGNGASRIYRLSHSLRAWLGENRIPIGIRGTAEGYRLQMGDAVGIRKSRLPTARNEIERLRRRWPATAFSVGEAVAFLQMPRRSVQRLLRGAVEARQLARRGEKGFTVYFSTGDGSCRPG